MKSVFGENLGGRDCRISTDLTKMWEKVESQVSGFFFSGSSTAKLDEKGRFVLPQEMRYGLVEEGKCEFALGLGLGGCLTIYRKSAMNEIVSRFREKQHMAQYQRFFTLFFSTLFHTECDKIGRVMIPATLRQAVGVEREIVVAGVLDKIEIWPKQVYDRNLSELIQGTESDLTKMAEEAFALLAGADAPATHSPLPKQGVPPFFPART